MFNEFKYPMDGFQREVEQEAVELVESGRASGWDAIEIARKRIMQRRREQSERIDEETTNDTESE